MPFHHPIASRFVRSSSLLSFSIYTIHPPPAGRQASPALVVSVSIYGNDSQALPSLSPSNLCTSLLTPPHVWKQACASACVLKSPQFRVFPEQSQSAPPTGPAGSSTVTGTAEPPAPCSTFTLEEHVLSILWSAEYSAVVTVKPQLYLMRDQSLAYSHQ